MLFVLLQSLAVKCKKRGQKHGHRMETVTVTTTWTQGSSSRVAEDFGCISLFRRQGSARNLFSGVRPSSGAASLVRARFGRTAVFLVRKRCCCRGRQHSGR